MQIVPLGRWSAKIEKNKGIERIFNCTYDSDVEVALSYDRMTGIIHDDCAKLNFYTGSILEVWPVGALANNPVEQRMLEVGVVVQTT